MWGAALSNFVGGIWYLAGPIALTKDRIMHTPHAQALTPISFTFSAPDHDRLMAADVRYVPSGDAKPVLVFVHGFKGFKDWGAWRLMMDILAQAGFVVVKANLSHNGTTVEAPTDFVDLEAFGRNTYSRELDDVGAWLDAIEAGQLPVPAEEVDASRLGIIGHSRGGALVLLKAAEDARVKAVATWAAVADLAKRYPDALKAEWKEKGVRYIPNARTGQQMPQYWSRMEDLEQNAERLSVPRAVASLTQPLLVVHGDADPTVLVADAEALASQQPTAQKLIVPGGDHVFQMRHPWSESTLPPEAQAVADRTAAFFKEVW